MIPASTRRFVLRSRRIAAALLLAMAGAASARAELLALRATEPVVIDGRLDEPSWARALPTEAFVGPLQPDGTVLPAPGRTRVRAQWDERTLYLAFECDGAPGPATLRERDVLLHTEEVVEVFLDFTGRGTDYVELQVSPAGVVADLYHRWPQPPTYPAAQIDEVQRRTHHSERSWNLPGLITAVSLVTEGGATRGWTAEIALPVSSLGFEVQSDAKVEPEQVFRANFVHYRYDPAPADGKPGLRQATWSPVLKGRPHISPMAMRPVRCVDLPRSDAWLSAWQAGSRLLVNDANRAFAAAGDSPAGATRESRFGEAVTLLNVQPKTGSNIERAHGLLRALVEENAGDDHGIMAAYYLGRIEQVHRATPDLPRALGHYEALMRAHPGHLFAQMAAVKACMLRLYALASDEPPARRLDQAETLQPFFTQPEARRDYHLVMADACARLGASAEREIAHLLAAEQAGPQDRTGRADLAVRVAELSRGLGQKDRAIEYYRKFLNEYSREVRVYLVQQRLKELEAQP